jgi:papain like protease
MADAIVTNIIPEQVDTAHRLGRHVRHDPRSWNFQAARAPKVVTTVHKRHCAPFDQGELGSCTGNAEAGLLMSDPLFQKGRVLTEEDAVKLYSQATHLDRVKGIYPPDDTGSSGLAVMKAAKQLGYITKYEHAFGLQQALEALVLSPVITGVNWYEGFDSPDSKGMVKISGGIRGGHEFEVVGVDAENQTVRACNSWGATWGDGGYFQFSWETWDQLLHEQGDVTTATA